MTKKETIDGIAYEAIKAKPTRMTDVQATRQAYKLARADARKIIKDARRQRRQARLAYKAAKLTYKASKLSNGSK